MNGDEPRGTGRGTRRGIAIGIGVVVLGVMLSGGGHLPDELLMPLAVVLAVGSLALIIRGEPLWRGVGIGVLMGFGAILLFLGAIAYMCATSA
ncbi:MAG TPA: hypothetical protein VF519_01885 [Mycobacteriales bacterium]|jgi:Na+/H+ antiporter NhaC